MATFGFNTAARPSNMQPQHTQNNRSPKERTHFSCTLCSKKQKGNHKIWFCPTYNIGALTRERMRQLGRCSNCAVHLNEHGQQCSHRAHCRSHPGQNHVSWLCADFINHTFKPDTNIPQQQWYQQQWTQQQQQPLQQQQGRQQNAYI